MSKWMDIGHKWDTETTYRIRELLKENKISFQMPFDEMFFQSMYHLPHRDRMWGLNIKKKDASCVLSLLEKEGLLHSSVQRPIVESRRPNLREAAGLCALPQNSFRF